MKHVFIVETPDDIRLDSATARALLDKLEVLVELRTGAPVWGLSQANVKSATRGVYQMYGLDQSQSPDQIGCAENAEDSK